MIASGEHIMKTREKDPNRYDDIINMDRPISKKHAPMKMKDRAAQFAPFAALTGHGQVVSDTADRNDRWIDEINTNEIFREDP